MSIRRAFRALVISACILAPADYLAQEKSPSNAGRLSPVDDHRAVLTKYCATCHSERMKAGGLVMSALDLTEPGRNADAWEQVVRKVRTGAMPPAGRPRPDRTVADNLVSWLEGELDRAALEHVNPGRPSLQRLNRAEYRNAIRDLLAVEIDAVAMLPADMAGHGFDNNADALTLSPALTERYLGAAAEISQMALARPRGLPTPETFFVPTDRDQGMRVSDDLPFGSRGGLAIRDFFPADGEYLFEMRPKESGAGGGYEGITAEPHDLNVGIDNVRVWTGTLGGPAFENIRGDARNKQVEDLLRFSVPVKAGLHLVQVFFTARTSAVLEDLFDTSLRRDPYRAGGGEPNLSSLTIAGPQPGGDGAASATLAASVESPSRKKLLICNANGSAGAAAAEACATKIISTLAGRAYRRPVTASDLEAPLARYRDGAAKGGFDAGLEMAIRSILVSPKFLFRLESQPASAMPNTPYRVSDLDLASRLSFFLWSSIPDDQLLEAAEKKTLSTPEGLQQQVRRMLADPRSQALVDNFAGQWLHLRNVASHQPSPEVLFHYDDNLRKAFERETQLFFESIIRENRSVIDLLDADYTYLNERLARHYGISGVQGQRFRKVALAADSPRRGLLGQGSILMATSYPNRTSPVIRGKWILENVFGAPPPPPPPNVPELKDERDPRKVLPMRQQLAAHRANPVCASCHAQMDQLGFALENFDAIGEWRDIYASGAAVDASAELPDGTRFNGPAELRQLLVKHSDEFLTTMTEKLLTYALGRGLEAGDAPAVRKVKRDAARDNYRFASLVQGIVTSTPFQMRMAQEHSN